MSCAADLGPSLLWTPCDPGEVRAAAVPCMLAQHRPCYEPSCVRLARRWQCHIYFSQQRKALGTAIAGGCVACIFTVEPPGSRACSIDERGRGRC